VSSASEPLAHPPFVPIRRAAIKSSNGVPRLTINGQPVVPMSFFFNTHQNPDYVARFQDPQVRLCAGAGVHVYSFLMPGANYNQGWDQVDHSATEKILDDFIRVDPQAVFILRYLPGPTGNWQEWRAIPKDQLWQYADGSLGANGWMLSLASEYYWGPSDRGTAEMIRHFEGSRYGGRILAYHLGGPQFEMFPDEYREKGPDVSLANTVRFRAWLTANYPGDGALQSAWGNPEVRLATAEVPRGAPGRFPMHMEMGSAPIQVFYSLPAEQIWVDYSRYVSELAADRVIRWAELVRRETAGRKLSIFCYGYLSELIGSFNGHGAMQRVMEHPAIDILMSPIPYQHRTSGQSAGFMSPVDSITAHGKLWLNEDDTRTHLVRQEDQPAWLSDGTFGKQAKDMHETLNLLERNLAQLVTHRAASWWMDLAGGGAFNDPAPWAMLRERLQLYDEVLKEPLSFRPEVAVLFDPESKYYVKSDWDAFYVGLMDLRDKCARSGVSVGWYTLKDFPGGVVPPCKAYLFANAYRLDSKQVQAIRARLDRERATAIWVYAPGYLGEKGPDLEQVRRLTGTRLAVDAGEQGSTGEGAFAGISWGGEGRGPNGFLVVSPRFVVDDPSALPLGRYQADGLISAARVATGRHTSVVLGDLGLSTPLLGQLFGDAGAHRWLRGGEVVLTDGRFLAVHSGTAGLKRIELPAGVTASAITGHIEKVDGSAICVPFAAGDTLWFRLDPAAGRRPRGWKHARSTR
jgi:hypothetical protein